MSNLTSNLEQECKTKSGCQTAKVILTPKTKDLGGFTVRRLLPVRACKSVGPWVFFDHMGPAVFDAGQGVDVRPHPHIGLATVTYLFDGEMLHRDSLGTEQIIRPGELNLMIAGRGVVHSERQRDKVKTVSHKLHGLQLWLALPESIEQSAPEFYHYDRSAIPNVVVNDVQVRVLIGSAYGVTSPVKTLSETLYIEARIDSGQTLILPTSPERAIYIVDGEICIGDRTLHKYDMAIVDESPEVKITALKPSLVTLVGGVPLGRRYIEWNFVASDKVLIEKAKEDWVAGRFAKVPGDEEEYIPLPG